MSTPPDSSRRRKALVISVATNKFLPLPTLLTTKQAGFVLEAIRHVLGVPAVLMVLYKDVLATKYIS